MASSIYVNNNNNGIYLPPTPTPTPSTPHIHGNTSTTTTSIGATAALPAASTSTTYQIHGRPQQQMPLDQMPGTHQFAIHQTQLSSNDSQPSSSSPLLQHHHHHHHHHQHQQVLSHDHDHDHDHDHHHHHYINEQHQITNTNEYDQDISGNMSTYSADMIDNVGYTTAIGDRIDNQDSFFINQIDGKDILMLGVFDGHGNLGDQASVIANEIINQHLTNSFDTDTPLDESIMESFSQANHTLIEEGQRQGFDNGTTATVAIVEKDRLTVGWVGDSGAVLCRYDSYRQAYHCMALTSDHRPENKAERARIEAGNGRVVNRYSVWRLVPSEQDYTDADIVRGRLALNMSRSLGHYILSQYGLSARPDINTVNIYPNDILIVASDGLWNAMDLCKVESILSKLHNASLLQLRNSNDGANDGGMSYESINTQTITEHLSREAQRICAKDNVECDNVTIC
ncbi:hypothetical protein SAMD00019534_017590, partial [Acytostelium subglobosum LB1]|uniref:hypothetical protein n=1 Tax=Acytostelium subglobosum LB1 TaxID=1410327 RepID=UPI000644E3C4